MATQAPQHPEGLPAIVAGGRSGSLAAALALVRQGYRVTVLEQAPESSKIGAAFRQHFGNPYAVIYRADVRCPCWKPRRGGIRMSFHTHTQVQRVARTTRIVISSREMGRPYDDAGTKRLVRNSLKVGRIQNGFYDAIEWLCRNVNNCLQQA